MPRPKRLYLVDGSSYIYRAYYAIRHLSNSKGLSTNAVLGFTNMLLKVLREERPDYVVVVFDAKRPTFRNELYPEYKANRAAMPEDLVPQVPLIKEVVRGLRIPAIEKEGFEADDIIATLARKAVDAGLEVTVVTGDKDLMQVVGDRVRLLDTMNDRVSGPEEVVAKFGVPPEQVVEVLGLAGDASDNIPGVPGIGAKTAGSLIREFGSIDNLLTQVDRVGGKKRRENLERYGDQARLSRELARLVYDVPVDLDLEGAARREPDVDALAPLFRELEFGRLLSEFSDQTRTTGEGYRCVLDPAGLDAIAAELQRADRIALDTETTGLDPRRAGLVGLSFSVRPGEATYIPVGHVGDGQPDQLDRDGVLDRLRPVLEDPARPKVGQNLKFDIQVLRRAGVTVAGVAFDTMIASYLARPGAKSHSLDALAAALLGHRTITFGEVTGKGKDRRGFEEVPVDEAAVYAAEDADIALRLVDELRPLLAETGQEALFRDVEMPLVEVLADMEWAGIRVDAAFLRGLSRELERRLAGLEAEIRELAGVAFNVASPKQLGEVLFEHLKLPRGRRTKTGWSTDAEVLARLAEDHPIAAKVLDYRTVAKLKSTYTDALPQLVNPDTGRIHTSFNQAVTATGRLSSSDPNLQNIPVRTEEGRRIRRAFVPADGNLLLSADYSQVELRVLAHMADEPEMKRAFAAGEDIHRRTAGEIFGVFPATVSDEQRRQAKTINFGVIYGMSAFGLAKALGIGRKEAQAFIDRYFDRYPRVRAFMDEMKARAREDAYVTTLLGRRCAIPEIRSRNPAVRGYAERNAINYPIQGTAADIIKVAMVAVHRRLAREGLAAKLVLQVHDELVLDVPEAEVDAVRRLVREEMERAVELSVPLEVDIGVGPDWSAAH